MICYKIDLPASEEAAKMSRSNEKEMISRTVALRQALQVEATVRGSLNMHRGSSLQPINSFPSSELTNHMYICHLRTSVIKARHV